MTFQNLLIKNCSKFQGKYIMKRIRYGVDDVEEPHLVKVLEEEGIGRPSTYAPIITTLIQRGYVQRLKGYL